MGVRSPEPGPLFEAATPRRPGRLSRRDRDWQLLIVVVTFAAMLVFEMFHSPPCRLGWTSCSGTEFVARIGINIIWAAVMGIATGIALAATMGLLVDSIDARRSEGTNVPLVRTGIAISAVVLVFVLVLVRFGFVSS